MSCAKFIHIFFFSHNYFAMKEELYSPNHKHGGGGVGGVENVVVVVSDDSSVIV